MKSLIFIALLCPSIVFAQDTVSVSEPVLRKRTHGLHWEVDSNITKVKIDGTTTETETKSSNTSLIYVYNIERFEIGAGLSSSLTDDGTKKVTSGSFAVLGHFNFIPNTPGNDLIPFVSLNFQTLRAESGAVEMTGSGVGYSIGLKWFPISEIFAVVVEFGGVSGKMSGGSPSVNATATMGAFKAGWAFYF